MKETTTMAEQVDLQTDEQADLQTDGTHAAETPAAETEPDSFPRSYVEELRREAAGYRERAGQADVLAERLHTALVAATGRLADATDLPYDAEHLDNDGALGAAIDVLLQRKPHLGSRKPSGDVGQGASGGGEPVNLAGMLRARAG